MANAKIPKPTQPRKLLVAAIGVATINYVAVGCGKTNITSGNLPAPHEPDASYPVGNLAMPVDAAPPPPPPPEAGTTPPTTGNLPAPVPRDAGTTTKKK